MSELLQILSDNLLVIVSCIFSFAIWSLNQKFLSVKAFNEREEALRLYVKSSNDEAMKALEEFKKEHKAELEQLRKEHKAEIEALRKECKAEIESIKKEMHLQFADIKEIKVSVNYIIDNMVEIKEYLFKRNKGNK